MHDVFSLFSVVQDTVIMPGTFYKTNQTGSTLDTLQYTNGAEEVLAILSLGVVTDGVHSFTLQDSADNGITDPWNAVTALGLQSTVPASITTANQGNQAYKIGYLGTKRYLRVISSSTGITGAAYSLAYAIGNGRNLPAS